jgi:hypothetical protein
MIWMKTNWRTKRAYPFICSTRRSVDRHPPDQLEQSSLVSEHSSQHGGSFYYCYPGFHQYSRIDLSLSDHDQLLSDLRYALTEVGFLYIENHGVPTSLISDLKNALPRLFSISLESKAEVALENSPHFLGYSGDGAETTAGKSDRREQFEFATELDATWKEGLPLRERLRGPNSVCKAPNTVLLLWLNHAQLSNGLIQP